MAALEVMPLLLSSGSEISYGQKRSRLTVCSQPRCQPATAPAPRPPHLQGRSPVERIRVTGAGAISPSSFSNDRFDLQRFPIPGWLACLGGREDRGDLLKSALGAKRRERLGLCAPCRYGNASYGGRTLLRGCLGDIDPLRVIEQLPKFESHPRLCLNAVIPLGGVRVPIALSCLAGSMNIVGIKSSRG